MARGGKFGLCHHQDRLLSAHPRRPDHDHCPTDHPEFAEEDVWSAHAGDSCGASSTASGPMARSTSWVADENGVGRAVGGLSLAFQDPSARSSPRIIRRGQDAAVARRSASSAPIRVPVQPRFLRVDSAESLVEDDVENDSEWIPPHEYLAREYAHSRTTTSVFEGVGRTLKGRDMSRVRNAVWTQTGFDG